MSTRSMIAIKDADDTFYAIYCHFDGYVSHIGKLLVNYFSSMEQAASLVNRGELRSIDLKECKDFSDNYYEEVEGDIIFEHFEDNFENRRIEYYDSEEDMINYFVMSDREYLYLWDDEHECWKYIVTYYDYDGKQYTTWMNVKESLNEVE